MKTIKDFCDTHCACPEGRAWALANCSTMQEAWDKAPDPSWAIWMATRKGVLTDRELRLFAVGCARQVQHLLTDPRSVNAIDVAERYANGEATDEELAAAGAAGWIANKAARMAAIWTSFRITGWLADSAEASAEARAAARTAQAQWLRENTKPNFA